MDIDLQQSCGQRESAGVIRAQRSARGFSMIDILVSIAVISVLIAIMLPAVSKVRESARKVICSSNMRQVGLGVSMYSQDNNDRLPHSRFLPKPTFNEVSNPSPHRMDTIHLSRSEFSGLKGKELWDGMGYLVGKDYITAPNVFYCPSHHGEYTFENASEDWRVLENEIVVNYLYRGAGPEGQRKIYNIRSTAALVTDTLRSYDDLNHEGGFNLLQAGLAVTWYDDVGDQIASDLLLRTDDDRGVNQSVNNAWGMLDGIPDTNDPDDGG